MRKNKVENLVKNRAAGLEDGKHIGSRFWEGLCGIFPALNSKINHESHMALKLKPRQYNAHNVHVIKDNNANCNRVGRTRRWEGIFTPKPYLLLISITLFLVIGFIFLVSALSDDDKLVLQNEFNNLTAQLNNNGYSWLFDYNLSYPSVEVFRQGDNNVLAVFDNITSEGWHKIFLTNLSDGESYSTFDLRSVGDVRKISRDIFQKKVRIDEIRKELNQEGGFKYWINQ